MFVADLHNDLIQRAMIGEDVSKFSKLGHSDLERLVASCIDFEILVIWVSTIDKSESAFQKANEMYDKLEELSNNNDLVDIPKNLDSIINNKSNGVLSVPIGIEGGEAIENSIDNLFHFIERGILYFGPTWNHSLDWVSSGKDEFENNDRIKIKGLSKFGEEVIHICNENNVLIDVSHIGEASFWDIIKNTKKPIIASHSSVYKLCPHFRNLKDDQIQAIKKNNGLIGLNPYPFFIDPTFKIREEKTRNTYREHLNEIADGQETEAGKWIAKQHFLQKKLSEICPDISVFIDHIEYITKMIGIDYVGIGSDYDGLDCLPKNWNDCMDHMKITEELDKRGYSTDEIEKIMGQNILRVLEEVLV